MKWYITTNIIIFLNGSCKFQREIITRYFQRFLENALFLNEYELRFVHSKQVV